MIVEVNHLKQEGDIARIAYCLDNKIAKSKDHKRFGDGTKGWVGRTLRYAVWNSTVCFQFDHPREVELAMDLLSSWKARQNIN